MSGESSHSRRHHHPVDSLCRKIQTINMLDKTSNPALQIPKLRSKNFDSPQGNVKKNLEEILKKRTLKSSEGSGTSHEASLLSPYSDEVFSPGPPTVVPSHRRVSDIRSENKTFSISRNKDRAGRSGLPTVQPESFSSPPLRGRETVLGYSPSAEQKSGVSRECNYFTSSPNWFAQELKSVQPVFQSPVAKRLSLGCRLSAVTKDYENSDVSFICEEDLLTTIFSACDVERRGKVAVSTIVDFLRHTTSRCPEDSSLEDLCNMLDPERRDISMDLETYHAIMKEWIDDCKQNRKEEAAKEETTDLEEPLIKLHESTLPAKRTPVRMNLTSGSLEALGGDVSKGDLETSDLIACVADLQFNNQKLQEENGQLKQAVDTMEEANNRLVEDSEEMRNQIKSFQQSVNKAKILQEELEEAKNNLNASEEKAGKLLMQNKQLEKENQSLMQKISSLQEENIRNVLDIDGLQKNIAELTRNVAELQLQVHICENTLMNKDASLLKKDLDIQELKSTLKEYATVVETLRAEKSKLVSNIQQMQQELISNGISFPLIYKFDSGDFEGTTSLHCELELAQESENTGVEWTAPDESLESEVLLLLQGPEQVGEKFKVTIRTLQEELSQLEELAGLQLLQTEDLETNRPEAFEKKLEALREDLAKKKALWLQKLSLLEAQKESLDKELLKMAGNLKRMRTEQLHLKKELSLRQHELESARQLQGEAVGEGDLLRSTLQELTKQLEDTSQKEKDQESDLRASAERAAAWQKRLEESIAEQRELRTANFSLAHACPALEENAKGQSAALALLRENHFNGLPGGALYQNTLCCKGRETQETTPFSYLSQSPTLNGLLPLSPLLDALALDCLQQNQKYSTSRTPAKAGVPRTTSVEQYLRNGSFLDVMSEGHKCGNCSASQQTEADYCISGTRMAQENGAALLTDVTSSGGIPSQDVSIPASGNREDSHVTDPALLRTVKERTCAAISAAGEEPVPSEQEAKEDGLNKMADVPAGDSSSTMAVSGVAVERSGPKTNVSPDEKEVEAEFLRLSLGFKCDLFTLEKRVRLEERSRDLAEENLKKEIASALKLLESLAPLSEDNQAREIVKKLQKSLELLNLYASRVASKAEMLGAIHQQSSLRRVSIAALPRNVGNASSGLPLVQLNETDGSDRNDKFNRRSSWSLVGAKPDEKRPALQRYISSHSWTESEEEQPETENIPVEPPAPDTRASKTRKLSEKESASSTWLHSAHTRISSWTSSLQTVFCRANKALCISLVVAVVLAVLSSFIMAFSFQRPADAAPIGTGNTWTSIQQLLWPHTGLRHEGPPPV
ncbi:inositol 1,4,5-triphosphate receptor associated 2 [Heteronotia binoei]|uniref:inositol 1,4,5-triphosphate receptor associated 2 n=1 Tax=Heteronotia binoei TaxID=13085 RepID=UPI00292CDA16|nr:inositol 1,4,5-triphosphate receptor associated 2 [Heteronotia binoei]